MKERTNDKNFPHTILRRFKGFTTANAHLDNRIRNLERVSTGSKTLDDMFCGGIETKAVTEFYGDSGSGKTQICHTLCATVAQDKAKGGLCGRSIYIDTEGTFRPERIQQIAKARGFDPDTILNNIIIEEALDNSGQQERIVQNFGRYFSENNSDDTSSNNNNKIKLLIVDSPINHYRAEYVGRKSLPKRQQQLYRFMHGLKKIAYHYRIAVVVTNHIHTVPDPYADSDSDSSRSREPVGGNVMRQAVTYGVYLKRTGLFHKAEIVFSPYHSRNMAEFDINEKGIVDYTENMVIKQEDADIEDDYGYTFK
jgi:DNA repair protein RadA